MDFFSKPVKRRVIDPLEPIPVGVVEESDWAAWADSVGLQDSPHTDFQNTAKQPLSPADGEFIDVFAGIAPKGQ
jgi:hypothetical protein